MLSHVHPAIDIEGLPRDVAIFRQHDQNVGNLFYRSKPAYRDNVGVNRDILRHISLYQRERHGVNRDSFFHYETGITVG